jgi:hypothetical protein
MITFVDTEHTFCLNPMDFKILKHRRLKFLTYLKDFIGRTAACFKVLFRDIEII